MNEEEQEDSQLEGLIGDTPSEEYPIEMLQNRRSKFIMSIPKKKKPGCPLLGGLLAFGVYVLVRIVDLLITILS